MATGIRIEEILLRILVCHLASKTCSFWVNNQTLTDILRIMGILSENGTIPFSQISILRAYIYVEFGGAYFY